MAKEQFKDGELCTDSIVYKIPDTTDLKIENSNLKDSQIKKALEIEVDVTHGGYVNKNGYFYTPEGQAKGVASFFIPYKKPVLAQHSTGDTPVGRTYAAVYIPLNNVNDSTDTLKPKCKIRVKSIITDQKAIDYLLDGRYFTVSSGGAPKEKPICSICKLAVNSEGCSHYRGTKYDDKICYWIIGEMEYKEYSFVNMPADSTPEHAASIVGLRFVDLSITDEQNVNFNLSDIKEEKIEDSENKTEDKTIKTEGSDNKTVKTEEKTEENADSELIELVAILADAKLKPIDIKKMLEKTQENSDNDVVQKEELTQLKTELQQRESQLADANSQIVQLNQDVRKKIVEKIIDLSIITRRDTVKDLICISDKTEYQNVYNVMVEDLNKRTTEELDVELVELQKDSILKVNDFEKVNDPTINDKTMEDRKTEVKKVIKKTPSEILFS